MTIVDHRYVGASSRRPQRGAVLVVSLIILLVVTLLTVGGMRGTMLEERMAGNAQDRNAAFQSAESAIREGELYVESIVSLGDFSTSAGLFGLTEAEPTYYVPATWEDASQHIVADSNLGSYQPPRYFIKNFTTVTGTEGAMNMSGYGDNKGTGDVTVFRITARGTGLGADSAEVILRTQYGRIF